MQENTFYLIHVPKTAGSTMRRLLLEHFSQGQVIDSWNKEDVFLEDPSKVKNASLILSHSGRCFSSFINRGIDYCMMLRDPAHLLLSQYLQIMKDPLHPIHPTAIELTAREFLLNTGFAKSFENVQTRHLCATSPAHYAMLEDILGFVDLERRPRELRSFLNTFDEQTIRYVGMLDDLASVYEQICADRQLIARPIPRLNIAHMAMTQEIEDVLGELAGYGELDRELIAKFEQKKARAVATPSELRVARVKYADTTRFPIESEFFTKGWHPPEPSPDGAAWYRWTCEERASVLVPATDRLRAITMTFSARDEDSIKHIKFDLNGVALKFEIFRNYTSEFFKYFVNIDVRSAVRSEPFCRLTISNVELSKPLGIEGEDPRTLGIYVEQINLIF